MVLDTVFWPLSYKITYPTVEMYGTGGLVTRLVTIRIVQTKSRLGLGV